MRGFYLCFVLFYCFVFHVLFIFAFIFEIELVLNEKFDIDFAPDQISSTGATNIDSYIYSKCFVLVPAQPLQLAYRQN